MDFKNKTYNLILKEQVIINNQNKNNIISINLDVYINGSKYCVIDAHIEKIISNNDITVIKPFNITTTSLFENEIMEFRMFTNTYLNNNYDYNFRCKYVCTTRNSSFHSDLTKEKLDKKPTKVYDKKKCSLM